MDVASDGGTTGRDEEGSSISKTKERWNRTHPSSEIDRFARSVRRKSQAPGDVLDRVDAYLAWFIPIVTALLAVVVGAVLSSARDWDAVTRVAAVSGCLMLLISVVLAVLSRFFSFQYRWFEAGVIRAVVQSISGMAQVVSNALREVAPDARSVQDVAAALQPDDGVEGAESSPTNVQALSEAFDPFMRELLRMSNVVPKTYRAHVLKTGGDESQEKKRQEAVQNAMEEVTDVIYLSTGPGVWSYRLLVSSQVFFGLALVAAFVAVLFAADVLTIAR